MTIFLYKLLLGFIVGSLIATFSYTTNLLTKSGAFAVIFIAGVVCGFGPWFTWLLLILFFGSSGCVHLAKKVMKIAKIDSIAEKGHTRDAWQVLANSLPAIISLVLFYYTENQLFMIGYVSAIAGATADTLGSEIGILSTHVPHSIITLKPIEPGLSGGISILGSVASIFGSLLISFAFWLFFGWNHFSQLPTSVMIIVPCICGIVNSIVDSLLGATLQAKYRCVICEQLTEQKKHHLQPSKLVNGISWLSNDWVNFFSGCLTILLSWVIIFYMY
ncbi:hypothetical protein IGJ02_000694 [Enterococcus sp. DIV0724b]|uniref:DUF92 domain-containing protein n=1 Tax=Enterococcus sp. DIV0724b TaxID=2774694 RepID=UPI003D2FD014